MPRVIVLDELSSEGLALLESAGNMEVEVRTGLKGQALRDALSEADGAMQNVPPKNGPFAITSIM